MAIRDRLHRMGFGIPDIGGLTDEFRSAFDELLAEIRGLRADTNARLDAILAELQTEAAEQ